MGEVGLTSLQERASRNRTRSESTEPDHPAADDTGPTTGSPALLRRMASIGEIAGLIGDNLATDDLIETITTANNARLTSKITFGLEKSAPGLEQLRQEILDLNRSIYKEILPPAGLPLSIGDLRNHPGTAEYIAAFAPISKIFPEQSKELIDGVIAFRPSHAKLLGIEAAFNNLDIGDHKIRSSLIDATIECLDKNPKSALKILKKRKFEFSLEQSGKVAQALKDHPGFYRYPESFDLTPSDKMRDATRQLSKIGNINVRAEAFLAAGRCDEPLDEESNGNIIDGALSVLDMEDESDVYASPVLGIGLRGRVRADHDCLKAIYHLKDHLSDDEQAGKFAQLLKRRPELYFFENSFGLTPAEGMHRATEYLDQIENNFNRASALVNAVKYKELMDDTNINTIANLALSVIETRSSDGAQYVAQSVSLRVLHGLKDSLSNALCARLMREMFENPELFHEMHETTKDPIRGIGREEPSTPADIHVVSSLTPSTPADQGEHPRPTISELRSQLGQAVTDTQPETRDRLSAMQEIIEQVLQISPREELRRIRNELQARRQGSLSSVDRNASSAASSLEAGAVGQEGARLTAQQAAILGNWPHLGQLTFSQMFELEPASSPGPGSQVESGSHANSGQSEHLEESWQHTQPPSDPGDVDPANLLSAHSSPESEHATENALKRSHSDDGQAGEPPARRQKPNDRGPRSRGADYGL